MDGARRWFILLTALLVAAGCGGGRDQASGPDCPTSTPGQPPATTTLDPRCVERATEREADGDQAAGRVWQGTITTAEGGPGFTGTTNGTFSVNVAPGGEVSGSGASHSTYSGAPPVDSRITVTGRRHDDSFRLTLSHDPGTRIDVTARITGMTAEGGIDLTGEMGTYSRGAVQLECQDCGDPGG